MNSSTPKNLTEFAKVSQEIERISTSEEKTSQDKENPLDLEQFRKDLNESKRDNSVQVPTQLSWREMKALKKSKYFNIKDKYTTSYVLRNKKTGMVAELQASSATHASHLIGWRPRQIEVLDVINKN